MKRNGERYSAAQYGYRFGIESALARMQADMNALRDRGEHRRVMDNIERARQKFSRDGSEIDRLLAECGIDMSENR